MDWFEASACFVNAGKKFHGRFHKNPWQLNALLEPYLHIHPSHLYGIFTCIDAGKWRWIRCVWLFSNEKSSRGKVENRQRLAVGTSQTVFEATHVWSWCQQCVPAIHAMELGTERHDAWIPAATDLTPFQSSRNCLRFLAEVALFGTSSTWVESQRRDRAHPRLL